MSNTAKMDTGPTQRIQLRELMRGRKKLILEHGDKPYLLSITRKGKLILTADHPVQSRGENHSADRTPQR